MAFGSFSSGAQELQSIMFLPNKDGPILRARTRQVFVGGGGGGGGGGVGGLTQD